MIGGDDSNETMVLTAAGRGHGPGKGWEDAMSATAEAGADGRMTQAEYARHRGVSPPAINKLVKAGKIALDENGKIDAAEADFKLGEDRSRINQRDVDAPGDDEARPGGVSGLTQARTVGAVYDAKMAELKWRAMAGELVRVPAVSEAAMQLIEACQRSVRLSGHADALLAAALKDGATGIRMVLRAMEREVLTRLCESFEKLVADAVAAGEVDAKGRETVDGE